MIHNLSTDGNKFETDFQRSLTVSDRGGELLAGVKLKKGRLVTGKDETLRCLFFFRFFNRRKKQLYNLCVKTVSVSLLIWLCFGKIVF